MTLVQAERIHPTIEQYQRKQGHTLILSSGQEFSIVARWPLSWMVINSPLGKEKHIHTEKPVRLGTEQRLQVRCIIASVNFNHRPGQKGSLPKAPAMLALLWFSSKSSPPEGKEVHGAEGCTHPEPVFTEPVPSVLSLDQAHRTPEFSDWVVSRLLLGTLWAFSLGPSFQVQTTLQWVDPWAWGYDWYLDVWVVMSRHSYTWPLAVGDGAGDRKAGGLPALSQF